MNGRQIVFLSFKQALDDIVKHLGLKTAHNGDIPVRINLPGRVFVPFVQLNPGVQLEERFAGGNKKHVVFDDAAGG